MLDVINKPGLKLIYGRESSGKSFLSLYFISKLLGPDEKAILMDSKASANVFRRLQGEKIENLLKRVMTIEITSFEGQERLILNVSKFFSRNARILVLDELTYPYELASLELSGNVERRKTLHRRLMFQGAYLRYEAMNSEAVVLALARERRDGEPVGGTILRNLADSTVRLEKKPGGKFRAKATLPSGHLAAEVSFRIVL